MACSIRRDVTDTYIQHRCQTSKRDAEYVVKVGINKMGERV